MEFCPLSGMPCHNKRTYHITEIDGDQVRTMDLCEECVTAYLQAHDLSEGQEPVSPPPTPAHDLSEGQEPVSPPPTPMIEPIKPDPEALIKNSITSLFKYITENVAKRHLVTPTCPQCGCTHKNIRDNGKLGCGNCYNYFEKLIPMILMTHHKALKHVGKVPKSFQTKTLSKDIHKVEEEMKEAIEQEDYERAATLRDNIAALKDQLASDEGVL